MADEGEIFNWSFIGLGVGIILFVKGFFWLRTKRMIENIPTSKIRSLAMGLVEIKGSVVAYKKPLLKSPFQGKPCVWFRYMIQEYRKSGKLVYYSLDDEHIRCIFDDGLEHILEL